MFSFKVIPCLKTYSHEWTECPFVHPVEVQGTVIQRDITTPVSLIPSFRNEDRASSERILEALKDGLVLKQTQVISCYLCRFCVMLIGVSSFHCREPSKVGKSSKPTTKISQLFGRWRLGKKRKLQSISCRSLGN